LARIGGGPPLVLKREGNGKMGSLCIYKVVIESSDGHETFQKDYIGPATSDEDAVGRALSAFKKRADDRVVTVELVDQDSWVEDEAALPPDGEEWVPL
jgi:hypothetical protein